MYNRLTTILFFSILLLTSVTFAAHAQEDGGLQRICPTSGIQTRGATFQPGGIIWTAFDGSGIWVYNVDINSRYPLPDTRPCGSNCHLSPDFRWMSYLNAAQGVFSKMRLDGTERTPLATDATEVIWWSPDTVLVWTPAQTAYLRTTGVGDTTLPYAPGLVSIQPGGKWAMLIQQQGEDFVRTLVDLDHFDPTTPFVNAVVLGLDVPYFNAAAWSPDGTQLAYTAPGTFDAANNIAGAELFSIRPGDTAPTQWTNLNATYGAVRINGHAPGGLSWSPDGTRIAFWVIELFNSDPETATGNAVLHMLDMTTGVVSVYCNFATSEHTPNPSRIVWSPDGTHIAFVGNVPGDNRGYLLLAMNVADGTLTELSEGVFPALGNPDVIAWGLPPQ